VQTLDDCMVKMPWGLVGASVVWGFLIHRQRHPGRRRLGFQEPVRLLDQFKVFTNAEIKAVPEIDDGADDARLFERSGSGAAYRPFKGALRVSSQK
jgi:hypothetical protein